MLEDWVEHIVGSYEEWESRFTSLDAHSTRNLVRDDVLEMLRPNWMLRRSLQQYHPSHSLLQFDPEDFHILRAKARLELLVSFVKKIDFLVKNDLNKHSNSARLVISAFGGESHNGGMRPVRLRQNGYLSRDIVVKFTDPEPYNILKMMCQRVTAGTGIDLRMPVIIQQCPDRTWYALPFISAPQAASWGHAKEFMRALGGLTCIAYALRLTDVHLENLLIEERRPIIIDPECLLSDLSRITKSDRLYATGLLAENPNLSAIRGGLNPLMSLAQNVDRRGRLNFVSVTESLRNSLPLVDGGFANAAEYSRELIGGFREVYSFLLSTRKENRRKIRQMVGSGLRVRALLRLSRHYVSVMQMISVYPFELGKKERERLKEVFTRSGSLELLNPELAVAEWQEMLEGDVPYFWYETDDVKVVRSRLGVFEAPWHNTSVRTDAETLFDEFSEADMNLQSEILRQFLAEPLPLTNASQFSNH